MHITLFKALRTINLNDDQATQVVAELEEYIAVKVTEANKGLEAKLDAQDAKLNTLTWVIGSTGLLIAVLSLAPAFTKLFN